MSDIVPAVRALLACPRCRGDLVDVAAAEGGPSGLVCRVCRLRYPVEDGIPVLLADRATPESHE